MSSTLETIRVGAHAYCALQPDHSLAWIALGVLLTGFGYLLSIPIRAMFRA